MYRLTMVDRQFDYMQYPHIWNLALQLSRDCSVVGSVWIALKYLGTQPYIPNAFHMSVASGVPPDYVIEAEAQDLKYIRYNISPFVHSLGPEHDTLEEGEIPIFF